MIYFSLVKRRIFDFLAIVLFAAIFISGETASFAAVDDTSSACSFNAIGDWTCPSSFNNTTGDADNPYAPVDNPFDGASPIFPTTVDGTDISGTIALLSQLFDFLDPSLQACLSTLFATSDVGDLNVLEIMNLLMQLTDMQSAFENVPQEISCPDGGNSSNEYADYMELMLTNALCSLSLSDLATGDTDISDIADEVYGLGTDQACTTPGTTYSIPSGSGSCEPVNDATIDTDIIAHLRHREGVRNCAYKDSLGKWTIGVGHLITSSDPYNSSTCLSDSEVDALLQQDMQKYKAAAVQQMAEMGVNSHEFLVALTSVNFQLGTGWTDKFPQTWQTIKNGQYSEAANMLNGTAWQTQTPTRVTDFQQALNNLEACLGGGTVTPGTPYSSSGSYGSSGSGGGGYSTGEGVPECMKNGIGGWTQAMSDTAIQVANSDNASSGQCTKGVGNVMEALGHPYQRALYASQQQHNLPAAGYTFLNVSIADAPPGCVLVYDNDHPEGPGGGKKYGHVEIVVLDSNGAKKCVAGIVGPCPSTTVEDNYLGCWYTNYGGGGGTSEYDPECSVSTATPSMPELSAAATPYSNLGLGFLDSILSSLSLPGIDLSGLSLGSIDLGMIDLGAISLDSIDLGALDLSAINLDSIIDLDLDSMLDLANIDLGDLDLGALNLDALNLDMLSDLNLDSVLDLANIDLGDLDLGALNLDALNLDMLSDLNLDSVLDLANIDLGDLDLGALNLDALNLDMLSDLNLDSVLDLANIDLGDLDLGALNLDALNLDMLSDLNLDSILDLDQLNLADINLSNIDLSAISLDSIDLSAINTAINDLTDLDLSLTSLADLDLAGIDLSAINLDGLDLDNVLDLANIDLGDLDIGDINLDSLNLDSISDLVDLDSVLDLANIDLGDLDIGDINLDSLNLDSISDLVDLDNVLDLANIDLGDLDLSDINLDNLSLDDLADLSSLDLDSIDLQDLGIDLENVSLGNLNINDLDLDVLDTIASVAYEDVVVDNVIGNLESALNSLDSAEIDAASAVMDSMVLDNIVTYDEPYVEVFDVEVQTGEDDDGNPIYTTYEVTEFMDVEISRYAQTYDSDDDDR